jgi:hypothetical protein
MLVQQVIARHTFHLMMTYMLTLCQLLNAHNHECCDTSTVIFIFQRINIHYLFNHGFEIFLNLVLYQYALVEEVQDRSVQDDL